MKARSILCPSLLAVSALLAGSVQADAPRAREFDLTYSARTADLPPGAAHDENRVQFSTGRDLVLNPPQAGAPLNYFIYPYAEVDGKPYPNVAKSFRFQDQDGRVAAR